MATWSRAALAGVISELLAAALGVVAYQLGSELYFRTMCGPACERNDVAGLLGLSASPVMFLGITWIGMMAYRHERTRRFAIPIAVAIGVLCALVVGFTVEMAAAGAA